MQVRSHLEGVGVPTDGILSGEKTRGQKRGRSLSVKRRGGRGE